MKEIFGGNKMRKTLLLKLADFLDKLPREKFDITIFANKDVKKNECGTKACALGWCPVAFPGSNFKLVEDKDTFYCTYFGKLFVPTYRDNNGHEHAYEHAGAKFFDIPVYDSEKLFIAYDTEAKMTPKQMAKLLRNYVKKAEKKIAAGKKITYMTDEEDSVYGEDDYNYELDEFN